MNYNYNQNYGQNYNQIEKQKRNGCIFVAIVILIVISITIGAITNIWNGVINLFSGTKYFNESFKYHKLEITVTDIKQTDYENGEFFATITFLAKNIGEETNYIDFDEDSLYLKNKITDEEYNMDSGTDISSNEKIEVGESKEYKARFTIPSSISSEKYILCFDFDSNRVVKYALYYETGEMLQVETTKYYYDNNIQALSAHFESKLAEEILSGLEKTNVLKDNTRLNSDWIVKRDTNTFELYNDFSIIISVNNNQFKIFTYETVYDEATAILLYDSANPAEIKTLSETERESLRSAQRKYQVQSTIDIFPSFGALLHNQLGYTYGEFSVKNKSNSSFVHLQVTIKPSLPGYESDFVETYTSWDEIKIGQTKPFTFKTTEWDNYDFFRITKIVIMFEDGTSIYFDEYDCQFLRD